MNNIENNNPSVNTQSAQNSNAESDINWGEIIGKLLAKWKLLSISAVVTVLIVYPLARTVPKFYSVEVKLAPELSSSGNSGGSLSSIMKSFGLGSANSNSGMDAINPTLYPDLMNSKAFQVSLFDVPIQTKDGKIKTSYYEYLRKHQKAPIWAAAMKSLADILSSKKEQETNQNVNAGALTKPQAAVATAISKKVICNVDNKTGVITIDVTDQDPVVCTTIADSTCKRLQDYITEYRTKKSRVEMQNVEKQFIQSKAAYEAAKAKVETFNNSNWDLVDEDMLEEKQALANEMQLQFSNMSAFNTQLIAARAKYESMRPVYTVLDGASVPLLPTGPSRMQTVLIALILVLGIEGAWIVYGETLKKKFHEFKNNSPSQK